MNRNAVKAVFLVTLSLSMLLLGGCKGVQANASAEAPPPAKIVNAFDVALFSVEHPEQFPLATATSQETAPELVVTGSVNPDIARSVPVISLASGRVVAIHARLGDRVKKGQLLLTVRSDDVSGAFSNYRKAMADEVLARTQLERAKDLYKDRTGYGRQGQGGY
jgi:cobalt-zinc-cadmium efflux system membrane fusion protein